MNEWVNKWKMNTKLRKMIILEFVTYPSLSLFLWVHSAHLFIFNGRVMALQHCMDFYQTSA